MVSSIPFNKPFIIGKELEYISQAVDLGHLSGDGPFTKKSHAWLEERFGARKALLTHSCTAALEMAAILADVGPGDEVVMPSYTFVSTANAFTLRGATITFVDVREDTLNLDETLLEAAVTEKTKVIVPVHYAGVGCDMDAIMAIANQYDLLVIEDAAQAVDSTYRGQWLGTIGHMGCYSFHETKNIICGEGGALLINDPRFVERAEIVREKGTNRSRFFRGEVDKYTWVDLGSSYLPSELVAAFLYAQLEKSELINAKRLEIWRRYRENLVPLEQDGFLRLPVVPEECKHNAHMFYVLVSDEEERGRLIAHLRAKSIHCVFHYVPLHSSPAGRRFGRASADLVVTESVSSRLVRLPCFFELTMDSVDFICDELHSFYRR